MKRGILMLVLTWLCLGNPDKSNAQDNHGIYYGTGQWDRSRLGNHRAVIEVYSDSPLVLVRVPWRRRDLHPEQKALILVDAFSGQTIRQFHVLAFHAEYADLAFQPLSGKGTYYLYYMPYETQEPWWCPNTVYPAGKENQDSVWLASTGFAKAETGSTVPDKLINTIGNEYPGARVTAFESINDFNSFYPMELIPTARELDSLLSVSKGKDFLLFPEDRKYPIRMETGIPARWISQGEQETFHGKAQPNEFYVYQLGVFAAFRDLDSISLSFSDLVSETKERVSASSIRCFNTGGTDGSGLPLLKKLVLPRGGVQALWIGIDLPGNIVPGVYSGLVTVTARGVQSRQVHISLQVTGQPLAGRGYDDLYRLARLNWLDSRIGLDDSLFKPYIPIRIRDHTVFILGRSLQYDRYGFPGQISSSFQPGNQVVNGPGRNILSAPVRFEAIRAGRSLVWAPGHLRIIDRHAGSVRWKTVNRSGSLVMEVEAKMECDGYVNYWVTLRASRDMDLEDIRLSIPYDRSVACYMMGMGRKGGYRPSSWNWKWEADKANNMIWVGDVNAGLQCKLKNVFPDWKLYGFDNTGTYKDWSNEGRGGAHFSEEGNTFRFTAYTGTRTIHGGESLHFNFGILITPLKPLDDHHWNERYFQADPPVTEWLDKAEAGGATLLNVHQGNELNPYINYPFIATDRLRDFTTKARSKGIRTKVYYTIRELSTNTAELWALRSLENEIFTQGAGGQLADQFSSGGSGGQSAVSGGSWLAEHLGGHYDAAWHTPLENGNWDMSIRTQGLSRWHNYYLEGLSWLIKNTGIRGLYLDGVGYDREIMKRVRKVMDRAADSCLIDFHSGNNFENAYGLNSPANQYLELFPFINSLWLGEGYNYNETPDYWLVEISGIPFGLYSEMLNGCGNTYRGLVYGMSTRLGWSGCNPTPIWKLWDSFGMQSSVFKGYWDPSNPVRSRDTSVLVSVFQRPEKLLVTYASWRNGEKDSGAKGLPLGTAQSREKLVNLDIDWEKLGWDPDKVRIHAPRIEGLQEGNTYKPGPVGDKKEGPALSSLPGEGGVLIIERNGGN